MKTPKPLKDRLLVKPLVTDKKTESGIIDVTKKENLAEVIAIGDEVKFIRVGDKIKYEEHCGIPYTFNNEPHLFLNETHQVVAII